MPPTLPLALPSPTDDLETSATKLAALADTVQQGNSLALFTGLQGVTPHTRDAETRARAQMPIEERQAYDGWKEGRYRLPVFDWERNVAAVPGGAASWKKFGQRAVSMDVIWGVGNEGKDADDKQAAAGAGGKDGNGHGGGGGLGQDKAGAGAGADSNSSNTIPDVLHSRGPVTATVTPENASWLTFNMPVMLPLVNAVTRVLNAQKQAQQDPHAGLSDMEAAEVETVRKIVVTVERNRSRELERIRRLTRSIGQNAEILKSRVTFLESKRKPPSSSGPSEGPGPSQTAWPREKKRKEMTDPEG